MSSTNIDSFGIVDEVIDYDSLFSDKDNPIGTVTDMGIFDGTLILKSMNDEFTFSFIDLYNGELLCRWGQIGEGPAECIDFGLGFTVFDSKLSFLSMEKKEINYVSLSDILGKKEIINVERELYPYTVDFRPMRMDIIGDKKILVGAFKEGRFGILDSMNTIIHTSFEYPFAVGEIPEIYKGSVFQSLIKSNTKQRKFVISTLISDIFEIYQMSDLDICQIYVAPLGNIPQTYESENRYSVDYNRSIAGLMKMAVSEELICFTYSDQSYEAASELGFASNEILCFNWDGEKIKKYVLPFPISNLCVDKYYIYGVRYYNDETIIYRFKL